MAFSDKQEFRIPRHIVQPGAVNGAMFWVKTKAASNQNLRVMSGASPVATLTAAGQSALFVCDGSVWDVVFHG